jgi:twinkle protein
VYDDGHGYCFSCGKHYQTVDGELQEQDKPKRERRSLVHGEYVPLPSRSLEFDTCKKFRYTVGHDDNGRPCHIATYCDESGQPVAQKLRYADKSFTWVGEPKQALLFGQQLWSPGRRVVVTEGEIDALSVSQTMNNKWPVVSVPNGAQGAKKDLAKHIEWLEGFERVVIMFDMDEPGQKAAKEVAELLTPGKAAIAALPRKDANAMLMQGEIDAITQASWNAKPYRPDGIVEGTDLWSQIIARPEHGLSYPWGGVDQMLYGMRRGEITCWTGGTGTGKSSLVAEVAHHLALTHGEKVGVIALEESVRRAALRQMSLHLNRQLHLPPVRDMTSEADMRKAFDATLGTGMYSFYDHFGSVEAKALLPKIKFMVLAFGAKHVILDHISIMVSGMATGGDERKRIDELMTALASLVSHLDFGLHIVSHLRKADGTAHEEGGRVLLRDLRGSGAIGQLSDTIIAAERDQQDANEANRMHLRVLKNRFAGETGLACDVVWEQETGRLIETGSLHAFPPVAEKQSREF